MQPQFSPMMQAPPPAGTTVKAPPRVGLPGAGGAVGASLTKALVAVVAETDALGSAPPTTARHPISKTNRPRLARSAIAEVDFLAISTFQMNCARPASPAIA